LAAGESIKEYLNKELKASLADAKKLWGMRQMVHGAKDLDFGSTQMSELPTSSSCSGPLSRGRLNNRWA
jgi:hypothetical protein